MNSPLIRLMVVVIAATLGGPFQLYQNSVIPNLYSHLDVWLTGRLVCPNGSTVEQQSAATTVAFQFGLISSLNNLGSVFGSLLLIPFSRRLPRRRTLLLIAVLTACNGLLAPVAFQLDSLLLLLAHRLCSGLLFAGGANLTGLLIGELTTVRHRGLLLAGQTLAVLAGGLLATLLTTPFLLGTADGWPYAMAVGPGLAALGLLVLPFVPESPRYLLLVRNDESACRRSIRFYQGSAAVDALVVELRSEATLGVNRADGVCAQLRQPGIVRALFTTCSLGLTIGLQGSMIIVTNITYLLHSFHVSYGVASLLTTVVIVSNMVPVLSGSYLVERWGRRPLKIASSFAFAIGWAALFFLKLAPESTLVSAAAVLLLLACYWCYYYNYAALLAVYTESFPQNVRLLGQCGTRVASQLGEFASVATFAPLCHWLGVTVVLLVYALGALLATLVGYALTPETKGLTYEQIYRQYFARNNEQTGEQIVVGDGGTRRASLYGTLP